MPHPVKPHLNGHSNDTFDSTDDGRDEDSTASVRSPFLSHTNPRPTIPTRGIDKRGRSGSRLGGRGQWYLTLMGLALTALISLVGFTHKQSLVTIASFVCQGPNQAIAPPPAACPAPSTCPTLTPPPTSSTSPYPTFLTSSVPPGWVSRYEMCRRAGSMEEDENLSLFHLNHFLLPHGPFTFPSLNVSASQMRFPNDTTSPIDEYLEVYVQEVLFSPITDTLRIAVIALTKGKLARRNLLYDWTMFISSLDLLAAQLTLTSSLSPGVGPVSISYSGLEGSTIYWLHFPVKWESKGDPLPESFTIDLRHEGLLSSSSQCGPLQRGQPWCEDSLTGTGGVAPFLRVSVCHKAYPRVTLTYCSNALHSPDVTPHLRSFLTYHAMLGIQRFIMYDHGYYEEALRPWEEAGLVDRRYWPLPNRNFPWDERADFNQVAMMAVCGALADDTSEYVAFFDFDEWLTFPTADAGHDRLQEARPSDPLMQPLQVTPITPSNCLSYTPQPKRVDPDIRLDLSLFPNALSPHLRCTSFLSIFLATQRRMVIQRKADRLHSLHRQLISHNSTRHPSYWTLKNEYDILRMGNFDPYEFAFFVYNYVETVEEKEERLRREAKAQAAWDEERGLKPNTSFHAAAPQRFHRRLIKHRGSDHKAIYRTPMKKSFWMHPLIPHKDYINPNNGHVSHFGSIIFTRWIAKSLQVLPQHTQGVTWGVDVGGGCY